MSRTGQVFLVTPSTEEGRPCIDFTFRQNPENNWLLVDQVLRGERPAKDYPSVLILVDHPEAEAWDLYTVPGTFGLMSERAVDLLLPYASGYFQFFQAWLNRASFFFLKRRLALDCLDRERSIFVPFGSGPHAIKLIKRFCFRKECIPDPLLFSIPDTPDLFATQTIERIIREEGLRGFRLVDAEQTEM